MKKKCFVCILLVMIFVFAVGCSKKVLKVSDDFLGGEYKPDRINFATIDEEINLDGKLDESFWLENSAFTYQSTGESILAQKGPTHAGFQDGSVSLKTYFSNEGLYIGAVVNDPVIYKTKASANKWQQSCLEIYISKPNGTLDDAKAVWLMPNDTVAFGEWVVQKDGNTGYYQTTAKGLDIAVSIDGEGINTENNVSYTMEAMLSWSDLDLTEQPDHVRVNPNVIRVREIPFEGTQPTYIFEKMGESVGCNYGYPASWLKFNKNGYVDKTVSKYVINAQAEKLTDTNSIYSVSTPEKSSAMNADEKRGFSFTSVIKEDGLYVFGEARHNYLNTSQSNYDRTSYFGVTVNKRDKTNYQMTIFPTSFIGFDNAKCSIVEKNKAVDGYNYQTYWEGFVSFETLSLNGVLIDETPINSTLYIGGEFKSNSTNNNAFESDAIVLKGESVRESDYWTVSPYGANIYNGSLNGVLSGGIAKIPVTKDGMQGFDRYDISRFENKPSLTRTDIDGKRSLSYTVYYEDGVGIWVKACANHNIWNANGSIDFWNKATNFEVQVGGQNAYEIAYITKIWGYNTSVGFDLHKSAMWTVKNTDSTKTEYTSYLVGLISEQWLIQKGITKSELNSGGVIVVGAFTSSMIKDDTATITNNGTPSAWWCVEARNVNANGYVVV